MSQQHPLGPSAMVLLLQPELGALLSLRMASDPMPPGVDFDLVDKALDRFAQQLGAENWLDAYHRIPSR